MEMCWPSLFIFMALEAVSPGFRAWLDMVLLFMSLSISTCDAFELNKHLCSLSIRVEFPSFGKQISDKQTDEYADCSRVITSVDPNLIRRVSISSGGNLDPDAADAPDAAAGMFVGVCPFFFISVWVFTFAVLLRMHVWSVFCVSGLCDILRITSLCCLFSSTPSHFPPSPLPL